MDSSYYNDLYKQYKKEADGYQKDIRMLTDIRDRISGDFRDEQNSVNKELSDLRSDLEKAVRHDAVFSSNASGCETFREKSASSDRYLAETLTALENEIAALNGKKAEAERNQSDSYSQYQTKKEEERREAMAALANLFS